MRQQIVMWYDARLKFRQAKLSIWEDYTRTIFIAKMSSLGSLNAELLFTICTRIPCNMSLSLTKFEMIVTSNIVRFLFIWDIPTLRHDKIFSSVGTWKILRGQDEKVHWVAEYSGSKTLQRQFWYFILLYLIFLYLFVCICVKNSTLLLSVVSQYCSVQLNNP